MAITTPSSHKVLAAFGLGRAAFSWAAFSRAASSRTVNNLQPAAEFLCRHQTPSGAREVEVFILIDHSNFAFEWRSSYAG